MSKDTAIAQAGAAITSAYVTLLGLDGSTPEEAAAAAWTPSGPSRDEIAARIRTRRGIATAA